jgi:hypothetical protein
MLARFLLLFPVLVAARTFAATPEHLALAREVMKAMEAEKILEALQPQLQQLGVQITRQLTAQYGFTAAEAAEITKVQERILALSTDSFRRLVPEMERAYADTYTEAELRAMKTFYSSPEGQAVLKKQPELVKRLGPAMQDAVLAIQPRIQLLIQQEANRIIEARR